MVCSLLVATVGTGVGVGVGQLRTEFLTNPLAVHDARPRLSWVLTSDRNGTLQRAYRIRVASTAEGLRRGAADLWDSGRIASGETNGIAYAGRALRSGERAWWTVEVESNRGEKAVGATSFWEAGLLRPSDWEAKWIGEPISPEPQGDVRWIWTSDATRNAAPSGTRHFRTTFTVTGTPKSAVLGVAADNHFEALLNGKPIGRGDTWQRYEKLDLGPHLRQGDNELVIRATNDDGAAGLAVLGRIEHADGQEQLLATSAAWEASVDGQAWSAANVIANLGDGPWGRLRWNASAQPAPYLRRSFDVAKPIKSARVFVSAKGLYRLFLDGKPVGKDIFTPGWTDYRKRIQYQAYDVTSALRPGAHALGLVLGDGWYCGNVGLTGRANYGERPRGLVQLELEYADGSRERVVTDERWGLGHGAIRENDLLMGEHFDARAEVSGWATAKFTGKWAAPVAEALGEVPLVGQHSPTVQTVAELKPRAITQPKPGVFVYDLGQNMVGWARLRVRGPEGAKVQLRFAEMLNPDGTIYTTNLRGAKATDTYVLRGKGVERYEPTFTFHGFRYVEVTGHPGVPDKGTITGIVATSATPQTGTFTTSNALVNQLQRNIEWGQRGNYLEVPTDCPQRDERLGWMGDAQVFARTATYNADVAAFMTKWMQDVVDAQSANGGFPDVAPRIGATNDGAPGWGDAGVIVPWTMYLVYNDRRILERHYDAMAEWIEFVDSANPDHIWSKRVNNNYGDWLNHNADTPKEVLATAYFAHSTGLMAKIARVLGRTEDAVRFERLREEIKKAFNDRFVKPDGQVLSNSQTAYVLALKFDLVAPELRPKIAERLANDITVVRKGHLSTGFLGVSYLNPTLTEAGRNDLAYKLLLNDTYPSWGYSIRQGATTIWERWDGWTQEKGFQDPGMNSFNHYSLGSVGEWMFGSVAGIDLDPDRPGFRHIVIRPQVGEALSHAEAKYDSINGRIESRWRKQKGGLTLEIVIPANTTATVLVPASDPSKVLASGEGVGTGRAFGGAVRYEVRSGRYSFRVKGP